MGALSLRLPESLHQKLGELAEREGISINQLITSAVAEKMSALMTEEYLAARANRATRQKSRRRSPRFPTWNQKSLTVFPTRGKTVSQEGVAASRRVAVASRCFINARLDRHCVRVEWRRGGRGGLGGVLGPGGW